MKSSLFRVVAFLTDFGLEDHYVGVVKGRILKELEGKGFPFFIDLTHKVPPQDIKKAALLLKFSYIYFPKDTIFFCIVDPGVGTERKALIIKTKDYYFIGPDNGIFTFILKENPCEVYEILQNKVLAPPYSSTFHARDLFALALVKLLKGEDLKDWAKPLKLEELVQLDFPKPERKPKGLELSVWYVDAFGNLVTNLERSEISQPFEIKVNENPIRLVKTYGEGKEGEVIALFGSEGFLEVAIKNGSAFERLGLPKIEIYFKD